jgi:hypothetical protein
MTTAAAAAGQHLFLYATQIVPTTVHQPDFRRPAYPSTSVRLSGYLLGGFIVQDSSHVRQGRKRLPLLRGLLHARSLVSQCPVRRDLRRSQLTAAVSGGFAVGANATFHGVRQRLLKCQSPSLCSFAARPVLYWRAIAKAWWESRQ